MVNISQGADLSEYLSIGRIVRVGYFPGGWRVNKQYYLIFSAGEFYAGERDYQKCQNPLSGL